MKNLLTTVAVLRPSHKWTVLFEHQPYGAALWALLFDPDESLMASEHLKNEWQNISKTGIADHVIGYQTTIGKARERLVKRLGPVRGFSQAWRAFSLTRALALSLAAIPADWPLRFDGRNVTMTRGTHYAQLMAVAVAAAAKLGNKPPQRDIEAIGLLLAMTHGMNPETPLVAPSDESSIYLPWPKFGTLVAYELLGKPVECPTSYVDTMTRVRHQWQTRW